MHCPTRIELEQYATRQTEDTSPNVHLLEEHLGDCSHCRKLLNAITEGEQLLQQLQFAVADSGPAAASTSVQLGDVLGKYQIVSKLYSGGQADVFAAKSSEAPETDYAIKVWRQSLGESREHRIRFERELKAIRSFNHPNLVRAIDGGIENSVGFLVMPLIQGQPLDEYCSRLDQSPGSTQLRCTLLLQVCEAVAYAHRRGIFHRDLKPSNILVEANGQPKILDFGLAKSHDQEALPQASDKSLTQSGQFLGTLAFAAPEQTLGIPDQVDARCDVYSMGVCAYQALTGCMPYRTNGPVAEVISNIQSAPIAPPSKFQSEINGDLDAVILKALEREPRDRYQTADAFRADLQNFLNGDIIEARRNSHWHLLVKSLRKNAWAVVVASLVILSTLAAGIFGCIAWFQSQKALNLANKNLKNERELSQAAVEAQQLAEQRAYMASITAATMAGNPRSAREWLENAPSDQRHWEWFYLQAVSDQTGQLFEGHERYVESVRYAGNDRVLSTGWDGNLKVWDVKQGHELKSMPLHKHVWGLAIHPNQTLAAVGDFDGRVHIVDLTEMRVIREIQGPAAPVFGCAFSDDGTQLACTFSFSKQSLVPPLRSKVCIFQCEDWSVKQELEVKTSTRVVVPFASDEWLVSGLSRSFRISSTEGILEELPASTSLCYSPTTQYVYLAEFGKELAAFDPSRGYDEPVWSLQAGVVNELAVDAEGKQLALAGRQSAVRVLDASTGQALLERVGHDWAVSTCDFVSGTELVTGGWDKTVRTWKLQPGAEVYQRWQGHTGAVHFLHSYQDNLCTGGQDGTLRVWNVPTGRTTQILDLGEALWCMASQPDGNRICLGLGDGTMVVAEYRGGRVSELSRVKFAEEGGVHDIVFIDENKVIACTANNLLVTYDLSVDEVLHEDRSHRGHIHRAIAVESKRLVTADHDVIRIWNRNSMEVLDEFKRSIYQDDFSLEFIDGQIVAGRNPGQIGIWSLASDGTAELLDTLNGHGDEVLDLAVHPDHSRLVSCAADGSTKIWDLRNRKLLTVLETGDLELCRVDFDPTGSVLLGGATDGSVLVWDMKEFERK